MLTFRSSLFRGITSALLLSGFIASRTFAASPTPSPAPKGGAAQVAAMPTLGGDTSGTSGTSGAPASILGGLNVPSGAISSNPDPEVIGRIGTTDIKAAEVRALVEALTPDERAAVTANPTLLKRVVLALLLERIVMKEVTDKKWDQQPDVQAHLDRVRESTIAEMYISTVTQPPAEYPSDAELMAAYDAHKAYFNVPHQFLISQIFVSQAHAGDAQAKFEAIYKSLRQPDADFAAIARAQSDDAKGASQGGSMGWLIDTKMPPLIRIQALGLAKNAVSNPIRLDDGWHIIKVMDSKDVSPLAFDEVKVKLAQQLRAERAKADREAYIEKLFEQNPVTIDDKRLPQVLGKPDK